MSGKRAVISGFLAIGLAYVAYPYVALYQLGQAIRQGDAATLHSMVDWPAVREGIKEDICDFVIDDPGTARQSGKLPPFGAGFMRGIASNAVDTSVTPEALLAATRQPRSGAALRDASMEVAWAFFDGPAGFVVDLSAPGQDTPIRLKMDLRDGSWQVTRVWLPPNLLGRARTRT